jgi:hypothetical protein
VVLHETQRAIISGKEPLLRKVIIERNLFTPVDKHGVLRSDAASVAQRAREQDIEIHSHKTHNSLVELLIVTMLKVINHSRVLEASAISNLVGVL